MYSHTFKRDELKQIGNDFPPHLLQLRVAACAGSSGRRSEPNPAQALFPSADPLSHIPSGTIESHQFISHTHL